MKKLGTWIVLYRDGMIFSEPIMVSNEELKGYVDSYKGKKIQLKVVSSKKANAIKHWFKYASGRVHSKVINGVKVEPLFPACADMGDHEYRKIGKDEEGKTYLRDSSGLSYYRTYPHGHADHKVSRRSSLS